MSDSFQIMDDDHIITTTLTVTSAHISQEPYLGLDALASLLQDTRMQHLHNHDMTEQNLENGIGYLISNMEIDILKPAYRFDELNIQIYSPGFKRNARGFELKYQITRQSDRAVIAQGITTQLFYDFQNRELTRAPDRFHTIMHRNLRLLKLPIDASAAA